MSAYLRIWIICCVFFLFHALEAKQKVCLNMIVKNETDVIRRCLDSAKPMIDYWVIVDTGSSDGTPKMICEHMKDIPGELHTRPWVNFSHNRNEALQLAQGKGDYILFIDADEYFVYEPDFALPDLKEACYYMVMSNGMMNTRKIHLIDNHLAWEWQGVLHEALVAKPEYSARSQGMIEGVKKIFTNEGARSKNPEKYKRDAETLEADLKENPNSTRSVFYLARCYESAGEYELALKNYEKRGAMGGWDEEVFEAWLAAALLYEQLKADKSQVVAAFSRAFKARPSRVEPLFHLARYLRLQKDYANAYAVAKIGVTIPSSSDILFVQQWIYDYGMALELSACAYWVDQFEECQKISQELLTNKLVSPENREIVKKNLEFANLQLFSQVAL